MENDVIQALTLCFDKAPEDAVNYLESQGIKITWDWREQLKSIEEHCFTVSKVSNTDILKMLLQELQTAMNEGTTIRDFERNTLRLLKEKGYGSKDDGSSWQLDLIYRQNLQDAYMRGRYKGQMDTVDEFPYWEVASVVDNRTTDICKNINGVILPASDPFWQSNYPPRHFRCRTRVRSVAREELVRRGLVLTNPKTVQGIKPAEGFDTDPSVWYQPDLTKYPPDLRTALQQLISNYP
jgi:SPP1 gp7 family putative phage head morphogenesis protein